MTLPVSVPGIADVVVLRGAEADPDAPPDLLVEVPHGADRRADYDRLLARLAGPLPDDLHVFFHVNTDVGAWAYGLRAAERVLAARPTTSALLVRCLVPRTFVDCNRAADATGGDLAKGGVTAGLAPYVRDPDDRALLLDLHGRYVGLVEAAYEAVCGRGGFALVPHTYGPRTLGIARVDDDIVPALRDAHRPEVYEGWPLRPEIDLLTRDPDDRELSPPGMADGLVGAFAAEGLTAALNDTYRLVPQTLGFVWAERYPGQTLCLEVRRDLIVERWTPFEEMIPQPEAVDRVARPIAAAVARWLAGRPR